ncbi:hypothetical protein [Novosphingobium sp. FKTRR1]|uniref:hypothetical protein n=1 Tax=Novosphingobium sp. FKTRR1 TaxID=2879118 RepID=UPI001CEFC8B8|nr:hypothetical protein [Novosphingobium sp. FKTRR1]
MTKARRAHVTESRLQRAIAAMQATGERIGGFEITDDGTIRVFTASSAPATPANSYDSWKGNGS